MPSQFMMNMNYEDALNFLIKKQSLGIQPGLARISVLLEAMGNPQNDLAIIHIAGTNGKGTISATAADCLIKAGHKVGVFTSPWVIDYREQIQINRCFIPEEVLADYVDRYKDYDATEFELLTAIMYKYFSDEEVDYAIVECGMGGLEDATNVETDNWAVISSISLDHTDFLGSTIEEIAKQKAGIIRKNSHCILYPNPACESVFEELCKEMDTKLLKIKDSGNVAENTMDTVSWILAFTNTGKEVTVKELAQLPARQERIGNILLDGGHNPSAAKYLADNLSEEVAVIGMMRDKNVDGYLSVVAPHCKKIIATTPTNPRSMPAAQLKKIAEKYCDDVIAVDNPIEAVLQKGVTLVCGSFFLARDVRETLLNM